MKKTILAFLFFCLLHTVASGSTIYVNAAATGANNGTSWTNAYTDLQSALTAAASGDEIWVAAGTYKPTAGTDRTISFVMKEGVALYGGFPDMGNPGFGDRDWITNLTTLSGDIGTAGDNLDNSYHVIFNNGNGLTSTAILDGFTISGGNANGGTVPNNFGGGMYNSGSSPSVSNCVFSGNLVSSAGGGMYNSSSSSSVTNCTFSDNSAAVNGGGMYNGSSSPSVTNCTFSNNTATGTGTGGGGGMYNNSGSSPSVSNCTFSNNTATGTGPGNGGGGIYNSSSSPSVSNCTFSGNSGRFGAGMYNAGSPTLTDCVFSGNSATTGGGGIHSTIPISLTNCSFLGNSATNGGGININSTSSSTLTNCLFLGNSASSIGGGFHCSNFGSFNLVNCSFSGNTAPTGGAVRRSNGTLTLTNCILWGNSTETNGTMTITYSIVQGGFSGTGNSDDDPEFVSQPPIGLGTSGDLHLSSGSAAYNAGNNAAVPGGVTTDLDGNPRITLGTVDMGAYESQAVLPVELVSFQAKVVERSVQLTWQTASESNNEGFDVQRSTDGKTWKELAFVPGNGTTNEAQDYSFLDETVVNSPIQGGSGVFYYRLRQTDFDGNFEYSPIVSADLTNLDFSNLRFFPNPATDAVTLALPADYTGEATLTLLDLTGRLVKTQSLHLDGHSAQVHIGLAGLPKGIYLAKVQAGQQQWLERLTIH